MKPRISALFAYLAPSVVAVVFAADQVEMQNGDRYIGKVISLSADTLVLQNDVLGTVKLPRSKVSVVSLGPAGGIKDARLEGRTNVAVASSPATDSNATRESAATLKQLAGSSNNVSAQTPAQLLEGAGPEAKAKFNELLSGLLSGKLSISDLRAEAKSVADQVRALRNELGEDAASSLDGYLAILDKFVNEEPPPAKRGSTPETPRKAAK